MLNNFNTRFNNINHNLSILVGHFQSFSCQITLNIVFYKRGKLINTMYYILLIFDDVCDVVRMNDQTQ